MTQRDNRGRLTQAATSVVGLPGALLQENLGWLDDNRQSSYVASRAALPGGSGAQTDARYYGYDVARRRLMSESYTPATGVAQTLGFQYDFGHAGLGIRTSASQGGSPVDDFQSYVAPGDTGATSKFARVLRQKSNEKVHDITATGNAFGAASVTARLEGVGALPNLSHPGWQDAVGDWNVPLRLWSGQHSLEAAAVHPGGTYSATATSNFSLTRLEEQVSHTYDEEGNVTQRSWSLSGRTQVLTWDGQGRLLAVADRDSALHGIDWNARYDGLGRRLRTVTQTVRFGGVVGDAVQEDSWYDPLYEFLEVAVETKIGGADAKRTWKVHGPDANGGYGGLQGIGGFEATVDEASGGWTAVVDDYYGHVVATVDGGETSTVSWQATRCASYGPQPGSPVVTLAHGVSVAQSTNWRGERMDVTGFYYLGARYYDPIDGRFVSPDPMGHGASMGLYEYCNSDPVSFVDPCGRIPYDPTNPSTWELPPSESGFWSSGQAGNGVWEFWHDRPEHQIFGGRIQYSAGVPDFSSHVVSVDVNGTRVRLENTIQLSSTRSTDRRRALNALAAQYHVDARDLTRAVQGLEMHHFGMTRTAQGMTGTVQFVPTEINQGIDHAGPQSAMRASARALKETSLFKKALILVGLVGFYDAGTSFAAGDYEEGALSAASEFTPPQLEVAMQMVGTMADATTTGRNTNFIIGQWHEALDARIGVDDRLHAIDYLNRVLSHDAKSADFYEYEVLNVVKFDRLDQLHSALVNDRSRSALQFDPIGKLQCRY